MWFLIEGHTKDIPKLIAAKVTVMELRISEPKRIKCIGFPENELSRVLEVLKLPPHPNQYTTDKKELVLIEPVGAFAENSSGLSQQDAIHKVLCKYSQKWGKNIWYYNALGRVSDPLYQADSLYVRFYSVPTRDSSNTRIHELFGHKLSQDQSEAYAPAKGVVSEIFFDGETAYAQLVDMTLYILCDLPRRGAQIGPILDAIMQKWESLKFTPQSEEELARKRADDFARYKTRYVEMCSERRTQDIERLKATIEESQKAIDSSREAMIAAIRQKEAGEHQLAKLEENTTLSNEEYSLEYDKLAANPKVIRVHAEGTLVSVYTTHLVTKPLERDETVRDLGEYLIKINTSSSGARVRILNLTRLVDGRNHPHVDRVGDVCFGNIDHTVWQLVSQYQFAILVNLMIKFIENPNEHDVAGQSVYIWPIAS